MNTNHIRGNNFDSAAANRSRMLSDKSMLSSAAKVKKTTPQLNQESRYRNPSHGSNPLMQSRSVSNLAGQPSKTGSLVKHQTFTNNQQRRNEDMTDMTPKFDQNS